MFSQELGTVFGYMYNSSITLMNNHIQNGLYCKSGIATNTSLFAAKCVEIAGVLTNFKNDNFKTLVPYTSGVKCPLTTDLQACRYYWRDSKNGMPAINTANLMGFDNCECSLSPEANSAGYGFCPTPS